MSKLQWQTLLTSRAALFIGLALVFLILVLIAQNLLVANPLAHTIFVAVGAATFGGGLTYFLVDTFQEGRKVFDPVARVPLHPKFAGIAGTMLPLL
jgi:uncharacterized PurR-regulated membrane protein YhhQ (DUF165 family)